MFVYFLYGIVEYGIIDVIIISKSNFETLVLNLATAYWDFCTLNVLPPGDNI